MQTTVDPGEVGSESLATSLAGELERLRFAILDTKQAFNGATDMTQWYVTPKTKWYINDTSNADMTIGLTINQGANDDQVLALKSSDVAHGITTQTETDTYGSLGKFTSTDGGLAVQGWSDLTQGLLLNGSHVTDSTLKTVAALGAVVIRGSLKSGTNLAVLGANANILTVGSHTDIKFILDADGDSHQDVGTAWTNFDSEDDIGLLTALSTGVSRPGDPLREGFHEFLAAHRERLTALKLVTFNDDGHHFVNMSKLAMLSLGAIRQLGTRLASVEEHQRRPRFGRWLKALVT